MPSIPSMASVASVLAMLPAALAGFNPSSSQNIAVYWGQNSANQDSTQNRLSAYCSGTSFNIIPLAFMNGISPAITNFANAGNNCTTFADNPNLLNCPQIAADIVSCQAAGKTIMLSLGGATYSQGGWSSTSAAQAAAQSVFNMFGPVSNTNVDRPFGSAVVDGFDFDFESGTNNLPAFAAELRSLINGAGGKKMYLSAAPQCVFPDAALGSTLNAVSFDWLQIQFYNNWCGVSNFQQGSTTQNAFNFDVWDNWAKTQSPNKNIKNLIGIPAAPGAGGGYTSGAQLDGAIAWSRQYSSFGGVMFWDMSQLYTNQAILSEVVKDIGGSSPPPPPVTTTSRGGSTPTTTGQPPSGTLVPQWGQCGGQGYTGSTQCQPPYKCVYGGQWWSSCQ